MMMKLISTALGVAISLCLLSGIAIVHQFAFYVSLAFNLLAWLAFLAGSVNEEAMSAIRQWWPLSAASSALSIYALVSTGHPILAASSFVFSTLCIAIALKPKQARGTP